MRGEGKDKEASLEMVAGWEESFMQVAWSDKNEYSKA
jgi:hypothetical protein